MAEKTLEDWRVGAVLRLWLPGGRGCTCSEPGCVAKTHATWCPKYTES